MKKTKKNPLVNDLVMEIFLGCDRFTAQDLQEILDDMDIPDGFMTEFREQCRKEAEIYVPEAGSWEFFENQLKIYLGDKYYNKI